MTVNVIKCRFSLLIVNMQYKVLLLEVEVDMTVTHTHTHPKNDQMNSRSTHTRLSGSEVTVAQVHSEL